jgi:hypothetical protein
MRDRVGGASLDAVAAENTARVVNVIDLGVALACGNALGIRIFRSFDVNAICGTGSGAKKATDALFETVFVALQDMNAAVAGLNRWRSVGEAFRCGLAKHGPQRNAEALNEGDKCFASFLNDIWHREITLTNLVRAGNGLIRKGFGRGHRENPGVAA